MILRDKNDREAWLREKSIESLKNNDFLQENDIVQVAETYSFYKIVKEVTDIPLKQGLYAQLYYFPLSSKDDFGRVKIGNGLIIEEGVLSHPDKHLPNEIATDENNRFVSDEQINNWNGKVNQTDFDEAINDIVDKAIKGATWKPPIPSFDKINEIYPEPKDTWTTIAMDTNEIYMYNEETSEWQELGSMLVPNLNFTNEKPSINEVGGIGKGTVFNNVSILDILNDMFYKKVDRNNVPEFYYGVVDNPNDYDTAKYNMKQYVRFPLKLNIDNIQNKHVVFFFKPTMESGEEIIHTDMFIQRISDELKEMFELDSSNIDLEKTFETKVVNIKGTNHIAITSKKILSGSYEFLIGRDSNRTLKMTKSLLNRINELESTIYRTKLKVEGGIN